MSKGPDVSGQEVPAYRKKSAPRDSELLHLTVMLPTPPFPTHQHNTQKRRPRHSFGIRRIIHWAQPIAKHFTVWAH